MSDKEWFKITCVLIKTKSATVRLEGSTPNEWVNQSFFGCDAPRGIEGQAFVQEIYEGCQESQFIVPEPS